MKKRLATLAILGAMTVSAVAPMSVFAADHQTNVKYVNGAVTPGGGDAGYYVTIPSDIVFTDDVTTATQKLALKSAALGDTLTDLSKTLSVSVKVQSANNAELQASGYDSMGYSVLYDSNQTLEADSGEVTLDSLSVSNPSIDGTATLDGGQTPVDAPKGTVFSDTLTYKIEQTAK